MQWFIGVIFCYPLSIHKFVTLLVLRPKYLGWTNFIYTNKNRFLAATKQLYERFCPSVRPSVCPSVRPSVRPTVCLAVWLSVTPFSLSSFPDRNSSLNWEMVMKWRTPGGAQILNWHRRGVQLYQWHPPIWLVIFCHSFRLFDDDAVAKHITFT